MTLTRRAIPFVLLGLLLPIGGFFLAVGSPPSSDTPKTPEASPAKSGPAVVVEGVYPVANAQKVHEAVAAPIENQMIGLEKVQHQFSRCTDDGRYTLVVRLEPGVDLDVFQLLVQNRVALALPELPIEVQNEGLRIRKQSADTFLLVTLYSPDERYDATYLSNYAAVYVRDELARLPCAADVALLGERGNRVQIKLDQEKLSALSLTAQDVKKALRKQGIGAADGPVARSNVDDLDKLEAIVLSAGPNGRVLLKDVAQVKLALADAQAAFLDGKPVVALRISANAEANEAKLRAAVRERMEQLKEEFPPGVDYSLTFDLSSTRHAKERMTAASYLLAEPLLPSGASPRRTQDVLKGSCALLKEIKGVQHVLSLPENPFGRFVGGPCVVALLAPNIKDSDREQLTQTARSQLDKVHDAELRLCALSEADGPRQSVFPVDLALRGPETEAVLKFAEKLTQRLERAGTMTDLSDVPEKNQVTRVEIDRDKAAALGVAISDIADVLHVYLGADAIGDVRRSGRTFQVQLRFAGQKADLPKIIGLLSVRNNQGQMVKLGTLVDVGDAVEPAYLDNLDGQPAVFISANLKPKVTLGEARWLCEKLAEETRKELRLSPEYRLVWMKAMPAAKPLADEPKAAEPPPLEVAVTKPVAREVTDYLDFTGRLDAVDTVDLRARVTGYLVHVNFKEGSEVKKGDLLYEIDARPYQAQVDQASSQVKLNEASLKLAQVTLERDETVAKVAKGSVTQQQLDLDKATVEEAKARLDAARASLELHKINLDWTKVRSPIDGQIGRTYLTAGNLVTQDKTLLATIVSRDPIYVYFDVDERAILKLKKVGEEDQPVLIGLSGEEGYTRKGKINFQSNRVNPNTGTVTMRAVVDNRDKKLLPGLFARVRLPNGAPHKVLLVPEEAIRSDHGLKVVYVVDEQNKVVYRPVTVGALHDGLRVIEKGLQPEERVILGGKRVRPGMTVKPVPAEVKPPDSNR